MGSEQQHPASVPSGQSAKTRGDAESRTGGRKFAGRRAKKPRLLAVVNEQCTACAGSPVCQIYCPVDECMILVPTSDGFPYGRIWVDPLKCVGCKKCIGQGPEGILLDGCPWDAIEMVPTPQWETLHGELPY